MAFNKADLEALTGTSGAIGVRGRCVERWNSLGLEVGVVSGWGFRTEGSVSMQSEPSKHRDYER